MARPRPNKPQMLDRATCRCRVDRAGSQMNKILIARFKFNDIQDLAPQGLPSFPGNSLRLFAHGESTASVPTMRR